MDLRRFNNDRVLAVYLASACAFSACLTAYAFIFSSEDFAIFDEWGQLGLLISLYSTVLIVQLPALAWIETQKGGRWLARGLYLLIGYGIVFLVFGAREGFNSVFSLALMTAMIFFVFCDLDARFNGER